MEVYGKNYRSGPYRQTWRHCNFRNFSEGFILAKPRIREILRIQNPRKLAKSLPFTGSGKACFSRELWTSQIYI